MNAMFGKTMVGLAVLAVTGLAQANATDEGIVDVAGSVSVDGWNELNRNRTSGALTEAERTAAAEQGREQRRRFLTPGSGYQPGNAQMFNGNN